ncbi:MAG: diaminopropionate ammonia-lyase [Oscillospiraceae bacterium]|nr:diaminopropionate ammonia-lyase [Oscillospiraceae bacterium]
MSGSIRYSPNATAFRGSPPVSLFGRDQAKKVREYHQGIPAYRPTALRSMAGLAGFLGLEKLYIKDESSRFGLNAFKGLGGSYCMGRILAEHAGIPAEELTYDRLREEDVKSISSGLTFVTATDGNHGRGIAWAAKQLGASAVVYLPKGSAAERLADIRALGARAEITGLNYDDTVRFAARCGEERGWILIQDTAWEGYEKIPAWIMQGYTTLALETVEQLGDEAPTHIFLQAGVGSLAGALSAFYADHYRERKPRIVIVEPEKADCIYRTASANDGTLHTVGGALDTIMAGLACGEPCSIGWDMLRRYADGFVSMPDETAAKGMRVLGNPPGQDERIISGESGAATAGFLFELMTRESLSELRKQLGIGRDSRVLCISTEGATDQESYRRIVWG